MHFSGKKLFLIGFVVLLLIGIPVTVYLVQQQQQITTRAEKATNLSFQPDSSVGAPITKDIGQDVPLDIMVDPGTNLVSFVKLEIQYDPDKLATVSANAFQVNNAVFPTVLGGPVYTPGKIVVSLSVGTDPTKAIQTKVRAATVTFRTIAGTGPSTPTLVTYSANTQALSLGPNDQASENVLAGSTPATILITGGEEPIPTEPIPTEPAPSEEPIPTEPIPSEEPIPTEAIPTVTGTPGANENPVCSALAADTLSGAAPLAVNFTATGTDADGTISKATFNFGDGQVSDVTTGGGIGTNSVNVPLAHTYTTAGTFQATTILTDNGDGVSDTTNCTQTITVSGESAGATATPTIAAAGSAEVLFGFGAVAMIFIIAGSFLFFVL
jgi:hypothetical protein